MSLLLSSAFAGLVVAGAPAADAASPDPAAGAVAAAEVAEPVGPVDKITVFATRAPSDPFDYPGGVTVLDRPVIDDFNLSSISELFDAVPGATFDSGPRRTGDAPSVRGVSGAGVQIFFDGARQGFSSGHDGRAFIDPTLLKAVEVVRGPTSALYGSGALGGVIAFRTIDAADVLDEGETAGIQIGAGYQDVNEEYRATTTGVFRTPDGRIDVLGSITYRDSGDIALGSGNDLAADDALYSSLLKSTVRPRDDLSISATWQRFAGESVDPNNPQGGNAAGPGNDLVDRLIASDTVQGLVSFRPNDSNLIDFDLVAYTARTEVEEDVIGSARIVTREVETLGFRLDNRSRFAIGETFSAVFTYGGEYYVDEQTGTDNTSIDGTRGGVPDAESRFTGVFAQGEFSLAAPLGAPGVLTLTPGVRWDRFESEAVGEADADDEAVSPKVALSYAPTDAFFIFANWAEGFRAPSFNELYADGAHFQIPDASAPPGPPQFVTNFFIANADLQPEESETIEFGAGVEFADLLSSGDQFTAKASYYKSDVENLIFLEVNIPAGCFGAPFPPCGSGAPFGNVSRNVNVTNAEIDGFELEATYDASRFYVRANASVIDGEDADTGEPAGVLTPNTAFVDAGLKFLGGAARLGSRLRLAGEFDETDDPNVERDAYAVGDVYAVWAPISGPLEGLRVDVGVDNVTDADYEVVAAGVSQPGRNAKIAVRWGRAF